MAYTSSVAPPTATIAPGIFGSNRRIAISAASVPTPTAAPCQLISGRLSHSNHTLGTNAPGSPAGWPSTSTDSPRKSFNCDTQIVTAIPVVNPVVTGYGMNLINVPNLNNPISTT